MNGNLYLTQGNDYERTTTKGQKQSNANDRNATQKERKNATQNSQQSNAEETKVAKQKLGTQTPPVT
jgi:hypothetical protein